MYNWETGAQVGWWQHIGDWELDEGLTSDWWPWVEDAEGYPEAIPWHVQSEGYVFLRLPQGAGKKLWHRQLWQDVNPQEP